MYFIGHREIANSLHSVNGCQQICRCFIGSKMYHHENYWLVPLMSPLEVQFKLKKMIPTLYGPISF